MRSDRKILIIDDNKDIHADFRKVFDIAHHYAEDLDELEADLFGASTNHQVSNDILLQVVLDFACQGEEGIDKAREAARRGEPYYMMFVDVRMPPGIDGIQTIKRLWQDFPDLPCVICTAFSDYDWEDIARELGRSGNLLILKKPFDAIEVLQLAQALAEKVDLARSVQNYLQTLERKVKALTETEAALQRYNEELLQAKDKLEAQAAELAKKSEQLESARSAAEAASRAKSDFLANMSHELRTPLNGVMGMTHLLLGSDLSRPQRRYARMAASSAEMLLRLINDILDFSKIEAGKLELEAIDLDVCYAVESVVELIAPQARKKGLEIACFVHPDIPARLIGDPGRLRQILANLTSNAVKFTQHGEVVVQAQLLEQTEQAVTVRFTVADTGIGIPPDRIDRLFQSFSQIDSSTTRKYGGTGLGLAISKRLCELMGGQVGVDSQPGKGSTFWCTLVLAKPPGGSPERPRVSTELRGTRILVVEDNATHRQILQQQLATWGFDCQTAPDGPGALGLLRAAVGSGTPFRLAILNIQMPGMSGEELAQAIKASPELANTLLVALSYLGDTIDVPQLRSRGFAECVTKPVQQSQLLDAVLRALAGSEVLSAAKGRDTSASFPSWSLAARGPGRSLVLERRTVTRSKRKRSRILLAEDNEINQSLIAAMLSKAGYPCDIVPDGRQVVEKLLRKRYDLILMDCHMPEMDGFEATRLIRESEKAGMLLGKNPGPLPIVALTANAMKGDRERCLEAGMTDYLSKPFNPERVIQMIDAYLASAKPQTRTPLGGDDEDLKKEEPRSPLVAKVQSGKHQKSPRESQSGNEAREAVPGSPAPGATQAPMPEASPSASVPLSAPSRFDFEVLLRRCMGDRELLDRVLAKFRERSAVDLDLLERVIAAGDAAQVERVAHGLKGAAANLSADMLRELAAGMEAFGRAADLGGASALLTELRRERERFFECVAANTDRRQSASGQPQTGQESPELCRF
jgi:two-component system, sensor histidine kinase and response regulator